VTSGDLALARELGAGIAAGDLIPYLGPGLLSTLGTTTTVPRSPDEVITALVTRAPVPGRLRRDLSASAQYVEGNQHRITLERILADAFQNEPPPTAFHAWLAGLGKASLIVDLWYDGLTTAALSASGRTDWGSGLGVSHPQSSKAWAAWFDHKGEPTPEAEIATRATVLYKPWGCVRPDGHWVISDSDFVELLTEIDIQSPIPETVKERRATRGFVFIGCRFDGELGRTFARQITKRAGGPLFAVLPDEPTRNEARFLDVAGIRRLACPLEETIAAMMAA